MKQGKALLNNFVTKDQVGPFHSHHDSWIYKTSINWHGSYQTSCCHQKRFIPWPEFPQIFFRITLQGTLCACTEAGSGCVQLKSVFPTPSSGNPANVLGINIPPKTQNQRETTARPARDPSHCWGLTAASREHILNPQTS